MSMMRNPAHPGEVLRDWIPDGMSVGQAAEAAQIDHSIFAGLLAGDASVTPEIAEKLGAWLGTSAELWMGMQTQWDLRQR
jgi:antitoxin HigA-1